MNILIVDDKKENRYLLESLLKGSGYQTYSATNGNEALGILDSQKIGLIISDIMMPEMDGFQFCKNVKSSKIFSPIPFIFYTATFTSRQDEILALKLGASKFIRKPMEPDKFIDIINGILKSKETGHLEPGKPKYKEETEILKLYNERLIKKLEHKIDELKDSELHYRTIFESTGTATLIVNKDTSIAMANHEVLPVTGYTTEEITDHKWTEFIAPESLQLMLKYHKLRRQESGQAPKKYEVRLINKAGQSRFALLDIKMIPDTTQSVISILDITDRKDAEEQYRSLFNNVPVGVFRSTPDGKVISANPTMVKIYGFDSVEELIKRQAEDFYYDKQDRKIMLAELEKQYHLINYQTREYRKDGSEIWVTTSYKAIRNPNGKIEFIDGVVEDITERKQAEKALQKAKQSYEQIFQSVGHPMMVLGKDQTILEANQVLQNLLGLPIDQIIGKKCYELMHQLDKSPDYCPFQKMLDSNTFESYTMPVEDLDRHFIVTCTPIKDADGEIERVIHVSTDITAQMNAEKELRESETKFRTFFDQSGDAVYIAAPEGMLRYVNQAGLDLFGFTLEEATLGNIQDLYVNPEERSIVTGEMQKKGHIKDYEVQLRRKDSQIIDCLLTAAARFDDSGKVISFQGIIHDITERKQREREYLKLFTAMEQSPISVIITDTNGKIEYVNPRFLDLTGYSSADVIGKNPRILSTGHTSNDDYAKMWETILAGQNWRGEFLNRKKNGELYWEDATIGPIKNETGEITHFIGLKVNITPRKKIMAELEGVHQIYHQTIENARGVPYKFSYQTGSYEFVSNNIEDLVGLKPQDFTPETMSRLIQSHVITDPDARITDPVEYGRAFRNGKIPHYQMDIEFHLDNGEHKWVSDFSTPVTDKETGKVIGSMGILMDITDRKKSEENILYQANLLQSVTDAIISTDRDFMITSWNTSAKIIYGWKAEEVIGKNFRDIVKPEYSYSSREEFNKKFTEDGFWSGEMVHHHKDGHPISVYSNVSDIKDSNGISIGRVSVNHDISAQKKAEEEKTALEDQLLQSQKMEAIGTLAGGVAHDFNNLLTIIQGHAQLLMMDLTESDPNYRELRQIVNASTRAANLTRQLLLFSRKEAMEFKSINLNQTVGNLQRMLQRLIGEDIQIDTFLGDDPWQVNADEGNLEQVIMNIAVNARDAMPHGGKVTIKTENIVLSKAESKIISESYSGRFVRLSIEDTGTGISPEIIDKIFEPFYSTKEVGKGTGLGLSVVYGIVKKHGGWINVYSESGLGTIFNIYLPAIESRDQKAEKKISGFQDLTGQGERILVIEDEEGVRNFAVAALRQNGYLTFEAENAAGALETFKNEKGRFDLILSDVVLPDKNGFKVVGELLAIHGNIPVIMCSGYTEERIKQSIIKEKGFRFLQKPYSVRPLLEMVKDTIRQI